jgi:hypothetical protein
MATAQDIQDLRTKMQEEREHLIAQIEAVDEKNAAVAPEDAEGEAQWSVKQQCAHLAEMESAYRAWVERALEEESPDVTSTRGEVVAISLENAHQYSIADLVSQLRKERDRTIALIEQISPDAYDRTATQRMFGTLTVLQWLRSYYRHDRMHQAQIAGRASGYQPRYATGQEPDQRRTRLQ